MCAITHRAKPYQFALHIKKSLDDVIGTQQSVYEATLQYQYLNIHTSIIYALFAESSIDTLSPLPTQPGGGGGHSGLNGYPLPNSRPER